MAKAKHGYSWPHRSRKAMIEYLAGHQGYFPMNSWNGGFVLAWNVKVRHVDDSGKSGGADYPAQARFDEAWEAEKESNPDMFWECCADAARLYLDGEWTNYPGIEQGEWRFTMNGRSNGYMILTHAPDWLPAPGRWRLFPMLWDSRDDFCDWLNALDTVTLRQFYRAIRVLDRDLRTEAAEAEVSHHYAFRRYHFEQGLIAQENCANRKLEASRPDMYGQA